MKASDFINLYSDKPNAEIRMYVVIDCDGQRTTMPVAWSEYRERDNEILVDYIDWDRVAPDCFDR